MRLLHVVPSFYPAHLYGGPIVSLHRLAIAQVRAGLDVRVLTSDANGPGRRLAGLGGRWVADHGVPTYYSRVIAGNDVSVEVAWKMLGLVRWAEVVHVTAVFSPTSLLAVLAGQPRPVVVSPRGSLLRWALERGWARKRAVLWGFGPLLRRVAGWHATSLEEQQAIREVVGGEAPVHVVENGIEEREVYRSDGTRPDIGDLLGPLAGAGPVITVLGRIDPVKGLDLALAALRELRRTHGRAVIVLAGPDRDGHGVAVRGEVSRLGLADAVHFPGLVTGVDKGRLLAGSDQLWLCSRMESFGNVVLESLAAGTPVVAVQSTPWAWLEQVGVGRWVPRDAEAIAEAARGYLMLGERDIWSLRRRCSQEVAARFSWPGIAGRMTELYEAAVAYRRGRL